MIIRSVTFLCCSFGLIAGQSTNHITGERTCGTRVQDDDVDRVRISITIPGRVPWHVGIYKSDTISNMFELICGGTIISPHIILTAASCVYDPVSRKAHNSNLFRITAGKLAFNWTSPDPDAQELAVKDIVVPETFLGNTSSNTDNVAILRLNVDFRLTDRILPICFDLNSNQYNTEVRHLQIAGWGLDGGVSKWPSLKEANFKNIGSTECIKRFSTELNSRFINYDKICVLTPGGRRDYDTGGGLFYKKDNRYHLLGIMDTYINNKFSPVTNLSRYLTWINNTIVLLDQSKRCKDGFHCLDGTCIQKAFACDGIKDCPDGTDEAPETCPTTGKPVDDTENSCLLPSQPGGENYTLQFCDSNCELKREAYLEQNQQVELSCSEGYAPKDIGLKPVYICIQGKWFPEDPKCLALCGPVKEPNVIFHCSYKGKLVDCNTLMRQGTVAKYTCIKHYKLVDASAFRHNVTCSDGGFWSDLMPKCDHECGIENPADSIEHTEVFGNKMIQGKYPWHVAIYRQIDFNGSYVNYCEGTLISENMVLTAAHCMFNETRNPLKKEQFRVAGGKFYRSWYRQEEHQQTSRLSSILFEESFLSNSSYYELDITLLITEKPFILSDYVLPVCLDYSPRTNRIKSNSWGTMVGWNMTADEGNAELQEFQRLIFTTVDCRKKLPTYITPWLRSDKFCVYYVNGTNSSTIGRPITLKMKGQHFVYGFVNFNGFSSDKIHSFGFMTNVTMYLEWISEMLNIYSRQFKIV